MSKFLFLLFLFPVVVFAAADPYEEIVRTKISKLMEEQKIPGVAVQLYENGNPHSYFFGYANREKKLPVTKYTIFEIGSITKIMTALIFAQQIDYAKMQLSTPLSTYFDNLPESLQKVTMQDLATHTSGLSYDLPDDVKDQQQLMTYLSQWKSENNKRMWLYSNLGISVLALALEKATHRDFNYLYRSRILNPLGMQLITSIIPNQLQRFYAQGYDKDDKPVAALPSTVLASAYALKTTVSDMQRFLSAAIGLPGTPIRILYPMRLTQAGYIKLSNSTQGLGWKIHYFDPKNPQKLLHEGRQPRGPLNFEEIERPIYNGNALIDKTGSTQGFQAYIAVIPAKKSGIVLLANKDSNQQSLIQTARDILFTVKDGSDSHDETLRKQDGK